MKSPKKFNKIFLSILAVSIIMLFIGMASENIPLLGFALLIAFGSFIFRAITFRCPYCGYYLGRRSGTYCPRCKKDIE
ncbi:MAG: hypothetical protein E7Z71_06220 [Methanocorpusculum parvum]|nr:hypothetical protein [Methanocorpusculum parvum]